MQWPDARTCRQPGHAACQTPRLTTAVTVLLAGLLFLGTLPSLTIAMSLHPGVPRHSSSSSASSASFQEGTFPAIHDASDRTRGHGTAGNEHLQADSRRDILRSWNLTHSRLTNQERQSRSLSFSDTVHNEYWLFFNDAGRFLYVQPNGTVGTTMNLNPANGLLQVTALPQEGNVSIPLLTGKMELRATLKGIRANKFLCMNRRGKFYAKENLNHTVLTEDCAFRQIINTKNYYTNLCRQKERKNKKKRKNCKYVCMGINSKNQLKRYCESAGESFLHLLPKKETSTTEEGIFSMPGVLSKTTLPVAPGNKGPDTPGQTLSKRRRINRRKNDRRRKGRRKLVDKPCQGLFCKPSTDRPVSEIPRPGRDYRRKRRRRKNRQRRRQRQKRPRRAEMTPEEGPFANVT